MMYVIVARNKFLNGDPDCFVKGYRTYYLYSEPSTFKFSKAAKTRCEYLNSGQNRQKNGQVFEVREYTPPVYTNFVGNVV